MSDIGKLYIVQMGDLDYYKIGFSINFKNRFHHLQTASPFKLKLIKEVLASREEEELIRLIAEKLGAKRLYGEWIEINSENLEKLISVLKTDKGKQLLEELK